MDNSITWLFGIEKYFHFIQDPDKKEFIRGIINLKYSDGPSKPWALKKLIALDYEKYNKDRREDRLNFYTNVCSSDEITTEETILTLQSIWPDDPLTNKLFKIVDLGRGDILATIFSKSQVLSKIWMAEILEKFDTKFDKILLVGGWLTHHSWFIKDINFFNAQGFDGPSLYFKFIMPLINSFLSGS